MAVRVPEMCFWPAKIRKNLEAFEMHTCLWRGAQICFTHKWRNLVTAFLLLHCIEGYSCLHYGNQFFSAVFQVLNLKFSRIALWLKRLQLDSTSDLTTNGLILGFFVQKWLFSLTSYLFGLKSSRIAQFLFFFVVINFFRCLGWGVFWSVL